MEAKIVLPKPPEVVPPAEPKKARQRTVYDPGTAPVRLYRTGSLLIVVGPLAGSRLPLLPERTTMGRAIENNIVLDEDRVSSHHAVIYRQDGTFWLEDLQSTNGTYLDGPDRIQQPMRLEHGQRIRIGGVVLEFHGEA